MGLATLPTAGGAGLGFSAERSRVEIQQSPKSERGVLLEFGSAPDSNDPNGSGDSERNSRLTRVNRRLLTRATGEVEAQAARSAASADPRRRASLDYIKQLQNMITLETPMEGGRGFAV